MGNNSKSKCSKSWPRHPWRWLTIFFFSELFKSGGRGHRLTLPRSNIAQCWSLVALRMSSPVELETLLGHLFVRSRMLFLRWLLLTLQYGHSLWCHHKLLERTWGRCVSWDWGRIRVLKLLKLYSYELFNFSL